MNSGPKNFLDQNLHRDDMHILSLSNLPFKTQGLLKAKMVKNAQLQTTIELFSGEGTGSGQVSIQDLYGIFPTSKKELDQDLPTLQAIAALPSFDVYSLRVSFRDLGIKVNDIHQLSLSDEKKMELAGKMAVFTRPLLLQIYGNNSLRISDMRDILRLFSDPNTDDALTNLRLMAQKLDMDLMKLPDFLEEYGDIFLSLTYFEAELEKIIPSISDFIAKLSIINENAQLKNDQSVQHMIRKVKIDLLRIIRSLKERITDFRQKFEVMLGKFDKYSFNEMKEIIQQNHSSLGGVLCGLAVKMKAWERKFEGANYISPNKLAEFVRTEIMTGLDYLTQLEENACRIPTDGNLRATV